jgi:hypothetical protein
MGGRIGLSNYPPFFMTEKNTEQQDASYQNRLYPEDQEKVDEFIKRGVNSVERGPFRPFRLLLFLVGVVTALSVFSQLLAKWAGVY